MMQRINRPVPITYIQMGALTAQEWQSFGIEISRPSNRGNQETEKTPYDLRLGALANGVICETCGETNKNCPGHWGYIPLEEPCYNPEYINYVLGIFKCICVKCYAPRISENMAGSILSLQRNVRFNTYKKKAETLKQCSECKEPLASFIIDKHNIKMFYEDKKNAVHITAREASAILMQISSDTMNLLGFNHDLSQNPKFMTDDIVLPQEKNHIHEIRPEAFIFIVLPVLPTCARPWVIKGSERKDDDITDKYNTILKLNERLRIDRESPTNAQPVKGRKKNGKLSEADRFRTIEDMHSNIWSMIDNSKEKSKNSGRKHKGLCERLEKKGGHIQINVAGKRSDFTARTVIVGGGSLLPMGVVGIPQHFAKTLTSPEIVLDWNIVEYEKMLAAGKINTVCRGSFTIDVREVTAKGTKPFVWKGQTGLQVFDVVHRHYRNGDWGIFNRQPTLRVESMQGAQVYILPSGSIFQTEYVMRLPLGMTRPFNADFDGDEFNMHAPQNKGAITECSTISRTAYHMISAQNNAPVMGCVQNTLVCMYLITETFETPEETAEDNTPNYQFPDGSMGYQTMVDLSDFMDAIQAAHISLERYQDLLKRAAKYYPQYVYKHKGHLKFLDKIPGKIVASIVFPSTFTWSRMTGINEKLPLVDIKDGIIQPNSGPLEKKTIGGVGGSAIHPLWKMSPDTALNAVSEFQFLQSVLITRIGFSMSASDCVPTGEIDVQGAITEALLQCEMISASSKDPADKEREINGALNEAMSVAPRLAKKGMNKLDRNALVIMKKSGAKGSDTNNGQIAGFVGQQNIDGKRMPTTLSNGMRSLPHFNKGDKSPAALGFVQHSYLEGLSFTEVWFHATGGRRGVVDTAMKTADSGYIQKKIVNAINDFKVHHDGSVRDANGSIVQFAYGGDGMNAKELINCKGLDYPFFVNPLTVADSLNSQAERLAEDDDTVDIGELRILNKAETTMLTSFIEYTCAGKKTEVSERVTFNLRTCLRAAIAKVKIYEYMIPNFCRKIKDEFEEARVKNGYMAGLVASSSIGEPTTQMTLNSVDWNTIIYVRIEADKLGLTQGGVVVAPIGKIIDMIIDNAKIVLHYENETEYVDVKGMQAQVTCVDENGKMHWKELEAVTRHLPGGKLVEIKTRLGRTVKVTKSKSLLVRENNKIVGKLGADIAVGDYVPLVMNAPKVENPLSEIDLVCHYPTLYLNRETGFLFGLYLTKEDEGHFILADYHPNGISYLLEFSCGTVSIGKHIPSWALIAELEFVRGLLDGFFSNAGDVTKDGRIMCKSKSEILLDGISELSTRLGIFGIRDANIFTIRDRFIGVFAAEVGFTDPIKQEKLTGLKYQKRGGVFDIIPGVCIGDHKGNYHRETLRDLSFTSTDPEERALLEEAVESEVYFDEIISVEEVESSTPKVYDLTVADTRNFTIFGGLCVRDTFHNAGNSAKDVTLGVPRFKELINATKNPSKPTCTVYLTNKKMKHIQEEHKTVSAKIKEAEKTKDEKKTEELKQALADLDKKGLYKITGLAQTFTYLSADFFIKSHILRYLAIDGEVPQASPIGILTYEEYEPKWWVTLAEGMGKEPKFAPQSWVLILSLDIDKMYRFGVSAEDIATRIEENSFGTRGYALACVSSPDNIGEMEVYLNFSEIGEYIRAEADLSGEEITRHLLTSENVEYFVARDVALDIIGKTEIKGIKNIEKTYVRQEYKTGEWVVDTQGTNLQRLLGTPGVDAMRTMSDDMWEIYNTFGIEVTRSFLFKEKNKILSFDGTYINPRHLYLLVDGMCRSGVITSVNRDGIPRNVGPVAKCMFEKAVDNFRTSAAFGEYDKMKGMAASVMFGTLAEAGSGTVDIKDTEKLPARRRAPIEIPLKPKKK